MTGEDQSAPGVWGQGRVLPRCFETVRCIRGHKKKADKKKGILFCRAINYEYGGGKVGVWMNDEGIDDAGDYDDDDGHVFHVLVVSFIVFRPVSQEL